MTNVAEFKEMLQEEVDEPLDYPRVPGLSAEELRDYNTGYVSACEIVLSENDRFTDREWVRWKVRTCKSCLIGYPENGHGWLAGRRAAFAWALAELEGLEGLEVQRWLPPVMREWVAGEPTPAAVLSKALYDAERYVRENPVPDLVAVPRARYNYLLEVERQAATFAESFARWEN